MRELKLNAMSGIGKVDPPGRSLVILLFRSNVNPVAYKQEKAVRVIAQSKRRSRVNDRNRTLTPDLVYVLSEDYMYVSGISMVSPEA